MRYKGSFKLLAKQLVIGYLVPSISNILSVCLLNPKTCHQNKFKKQNLRRQRNEKNSPVWAKKQIAYDPSTDYNRFTKALG